ncbi:MAG TPA: hypothetical protein VFR78_07615 [Pyrinomonadaceae bacterium]|nr:hypothetical protein [Pyrinomonadaceae bacterium]
MTGEHVLVPRLRLKVETELPMRDEYEQFVAKLIEDSNLLR